MYSIDTELKHLLEQDRERNANERMRLELEERRLALQENQFERDAEECKATADLLRILVSNLARK